MSKNTNTVAFADLLPGQGGRGHKTGLPRLVGTPLGGKSIVERALSNKTRKVIIDHDEVVAAARAALEAHTAETGVKVEASDEELLAHYIRNFTTAARQYAKGKGARLNIQTKAATKAGKGRVVVEVAS